MTTNDSHVFQTCSFSDRPIGTLPLRTTCVLDVSNGANHTLLLLKVQMTNDKESTTEVWGCGDGRVGQLGTKFRQHEPVSVFHKLDFETVFDELGLEKFAIKSIGATWETSYLVVARPGYHDVIISFGSNDFGDLGVGRDAEDKMAEKGTGVHIVDLSHVSVAGKPINSAKTVNIEKLQTGQRHVIVSLRVVWDGREPTQVLIGWGACRHGQLGDVTGSSKSPNQNSLANVSRTKTKNIVSSPSTYCSRPILLWVYDSPSDFIVDFSLGIHHSAFLHASGRVSAKGSNRKSQIQGLESFQNISDIKCTWNGTYVLTADVPPCILSIGSNSHGQLGRTENSPTLQIEDLPLTYTTVKALACGSEHALIILTTNEKGDEVWGWGWNEHGNLGLGNTRDCSAPQKVWPFSDGFDSPGARVRNIWAGYGTSWILCETQDDMIESST